MSAVFVLSASGSAEANVEVRSAYSKLQTYNAALRYLRVDLSYAVTEKDPDAAYLLFHFKPDGRQKDTNGAIEIIERKDDVLVTVRLPERPHYEEEMLSDGLFRKLRTEYGEPLPREDTPKPRDKDKHKDKDKDKDKDEDQDAPDAGD